MSAGVLSHAGRDSARQALCASPPRARPRRYAGCLLTLSTPCRVVWSRSLHATADLFFVLKRNWGDPDQATAAAIGVEAAAGSGVSALANPAARDMLLRMPGVTPANVRPLMDACGSLQGLARMRHEDIAAAIGKQPAKSLYEFLHMPFPASS